MKKQIKQSMSLIVSSLLIFQQSLIAKSIVVDTNASKQNQANIDKSRNNIPIVNIVKPNKKGLSHNKFSDYNVNKEGVILNNANKREVNTQLAGYIYGNENLKQGTAKTILNEVTSKNRTHLKGFTEIAGDKANVVVANPNGIYINGAGFINTKKATITTGNPNIINGEINSFEVKQGKIEIDGNGLNLSNVNKAELYAQTVKLNAKIQAQDLDIVTGKNSISKNGTITNIENLEPKDDDKPILSLDSSSLGGIYANKINLIGTQKGVGVNLPIEIMSQDDLKLSADGKIVLDKAISEKNIDIKSESSDINSKIIYGKNVNIEAKESINNEDIIASKINIDLKAKNIINENLIASGVEKDLKDSNSGNLNLQSENLENKKSLYAKDNIDINSTNVKNQKDSSIIAKNDISIDAKGIRNEENAIVANNINISTLNLSSKASKYLASNSVDLNLDKSVVFLDNNFVANSLNLSINENLVLDKSNSFLAQDSIVFESKSLINNAQFVSNENLTINTSDFIVNNSLLNAKNNLNLNATNYILNNDSDETMFGIRGAFTNLNTKLLTNYGFISSLSDLNIKVDDLINYGAIASANAENKASNLNIAASNLTNYNTIYSNDNINFYIKNSLKNITNNNMVDLGSEKAVIFATNNINIQGDKNRTLRTDEIINDKAIIQTQNGDIDIFAKKLENLASKVEVKGNLVQGDAPYIQDGTRIDTKIIARDKSGYTYNSYRIYTDIMTYKAYENSEIISGNNINLDVNSLNNNYSLVYANNNMLLNIDRLVNNSIDISQVITTYKDMYIKERYCKKKFLGKCVNHSNRSKFIGTEIYYDLSVIDKINSTIQAGGEIIGNIDNLQNGIIENKTKELITYSPTANTKLKTADLKDKIVLNPIDENYILPTNKYSIFTTTQDKTLDYLVESNPLYTNLSNFIGSSYFLEKINYQGDRVVKRLGDAGYETKLVSDAIFNQTGQRFLNQNYSSENEQFVALMNNAVNQSNILDLELGKPLTSSQLASLKEDIVWMEEQIVNNQTVLVPVLYLANNYEKLDGATIKANSIDLNIKDSFVNSGTIKTNDYLNLNANAITNSAGVIISNGKATLISNEDFINKNGGLIKASDIQIASLNGSVINEIYSKTNNLNLGKNDFTYTNVGKTSSIEATNGNLVIQAKDNIINSGSNLIAKDSLLLQTQNGDINLNAIKLENGHNVYFSKGFDKAKDVEYQTSDINANNILMQSGNNINLEATKLQADNQINLNASNDVNILALNSEYYRDTKTTSKGTFSKSVKRDMEYRETVNSGELNANDIVINASNDVNIEASKLKAQDNIIVNSENGDLNIVAKEYREGELHERSKSSFGGLKKSLDISSSDALKLNSALLQTEASNVILTSGKDINILASEISSGNLLLADANKNLNILSGEELSQTQEIHQKSSFSPSFSGKTLVLAKEKTTKDTDTISTQKSSNLSGKDVLLQAKDEMTIIGSNVVGKNVVLNADDINLLSATQNSDNEHISSTKKVGIGVTLNLKEASVFAGAEIEKNKINQGNTTQKASNIVADDITIVSNNNTNILASNLVADNNLAIVTGKNLNILSKEAIDYKDEVHTYLKTGVSLGVKQNITQGAKYIVNTTKGIVKSDNIANSGFGTLKLIDNISSTLSSPVSAGLNAVAQMKQNKSSSTNEYAQSSNIYVGNSAVLSANDSLNIKGSDIFVNNSLDIFAKNLNVEASRQKSNSNSSNKSLDLSVGLYNPKLDASINQGKQNFDSLVYKNSTITSKDLNLNIDNSAKFEGANVKAQNINANIGKDLIIASLQNNSNSKGDNKSLSAGTNSGSIGYGKNENQRDWVDNQTTIIGTNSVNVTVGDNTHLKGAVIASGNYDENGNFIDNKNLNLTTKTLTSENIKDKDKGNSYNINLGFSNKTENQGKIELGLSNSNKEQISYATIGNGTIITNSDIKDINQDVNKSQVITKDKNSNYDIYLSNTSIDKVLKPNDTVAKWTQDAKDLESNIQKEIEENIPKASSDNSFESTIGNIWDIYGKLTLGLVPTNANNAGLLANIPGYLGVYDSLHQTQGDKNSKNVYINGILNSKEDSMQGGKNIIGEDENYLNIYNPSRGFLADLIEAAVDKWGSIIGMQTGISKQTQEYLNNNPDLNVYMHSQGHLIAKQGALSSKDNNHTYKSYGAPMSDEDIGVIFKTKANKNDGDYVAKPLNVFNPSTWNKPGHGTENYGASKQAKEQGAK